MSAKDEAELYLPKKWWQRLENWDHVRECTFTVVSFLNDLILYDVFYYMSRVAWNFWRDVYRLHFSERRMCWDGLSLVLQTGRCPRLSFTEWMTGWIGEAPKRLARTCLCQLNWSVFVRYENSPTIYCIRNALILPAVLSAEHSPL